MYIRIFEKLGRMFPALAASALVVGAFTATTVAQPEIQDIAPPPLKIVSKEELAQLDALTDVKKRTRAALELMSARLTSAETLIAEDRLDDMYKQLGGFHGLMDNTLAFLDKSDSNSRKVLSNYKRFEMGLRQFRPRLELIRRTIPLSHEPYVKNLILYLRDARTKAIEPFFSDSVVPKRTKP